jgi:hypothetical protein
MIIISRLNFVEVDWTRREKKQNLPALNSLFKVWWVVRNEKSVNKGKANGAG